MLKYLEKEALEISQEAMLNFDSLRELPHRFTTFFASMRSHLKDTLDNLPHAHKSLDSRFFSGKTKELDYTALSNLEVSAPPGLKVDMLTYGSTLKALQDVHVKTLLSEVLSPMANWTARLVSDPEFLNTVRDLKKESGIRLKDIDGARKQIGDMLQQNDMTDRISYARAFKRNLDVTTCVNISNEMNVVAAGISNKDLIETVNQVVYSVACVVKHVEKHGQGSINGRIVKDLTETLFDLAKAVEFYSSHCYLISMYSDCLEVTGEKLEKLK